MLSVLGLIFSRFMTYKIILIYVFILKTEVIQLKHKSLIYLIFNLITLMSGQFKYSVLLWMRSVFCPSVNN